jgi:hypothetical protein
MSSDTEKLQNDINYINRRTQQVLDEVAAIDADTTRSNEWKAEKRQPLVEQAREDIELFYTTGLEFFKERVAAHEKTIAYNPVTPSETEIAQLQYTRDALTQKWQRMTPAEMAKDWTLALEKDDMITARVYRDFSRAQFEEALPERERGVGPAPHYHDLAQQTNERFLTDEQREARDQLAKLKAMEIELHKSHGNAKLAFGVHFNRDMRSGLTSVERVWMDTLRKSK